jgi:hypothetical protein
MKNDQKCKEGITNDLFDSYFPGGKQELRMEMEKYYSHTKTYDYSKVNIFPEFLVPPISHYLWLTSKNDPREIKENDLQNIFNNLQMIKDSSSFPQDWQHILWVNDKNLIPKTVERVSNSDLEIKELSEIKSFMYSYNLSMKTFEQKHLGLSVDIIRMDLLNIFGGFYADLNYKIKYSPELLMKKFNFIVESDVENPMDVENNMIISSPDHPITRNFLEKAVNETLVETTIEKYKDCSKELFADMLSWGMFRTTVAKNLASPNYNNLIIIDNNKKDSHGNPYCHNTDMSNELTQIFYDTAADLIEQQSICNLESFGDDSRIDNRSWV